MSLYFFLAFRWLIARMNEADTGWDDDFVVNQFGERVRHFVSYVSDTDEFGETIRSTEREVVKTVVEGDFGDISYEYDIVTEGVDSTISVSWYHNGDSGRDMDNLPTVSVRELLRMMRALDASLRRTIKTLIGLPIITYGLWYDGDDQMDRRISLYKRWAERIEADGIAIVDVIESAPDWAHKEEIPEDVWVSVEPNWEQVDEDAPVVEGSYTPLVYVDADDNEMTGEALADLMDDITA